MAIHSYNTDITQTGSLTPAISLAAGDTVFLGSEATITSIGGTADGVSGPGGNSQAYVNGEIFANYAGLYFSSGSTGHNSIFVGSGGSITGRSYGALIYGPANVFINNGDLNGNIAVRFGGGGANLENSGQISGIETGVYFSGTGRSSNTLTNSGEIRCPDTAVSGSGVRDTVLNSGFISGDISLRGGSDSFNNTGGQLAGKAYLGTGTDTYTGGQSFDGVSGGEGNDSIALMGGDDIYFADASDGNDELDGGDGRDTYNAASAGAAVEVDLSGAHAIGTSIGHDDILNFERVVGSSLGDTLRGSEESNTLRGGAGADVIAGVDGNDWINGGAGGDFLFGQGGHDILTGGTGADLFTYSGLFESAPGYSNRDVITDFTVGVDDIKLTAIDANAGLGGDQGFNFIGAGAFTGVAQQLHYTLAGKATIIAGDVNGDGAADFEIQLSGSAGGNVIPAAGDFLL